jgi:2-deoxy-D-gluconate 3-dehydrogenase
LAIAEALAAAGADIIAASSHLEPHGAEVVSRVAALGRQCSVHAVDLADRQAVAAFIAEILAAGRAPDIVVNNAGTIFRAPALEYPDAEWDRVVEVDLAAQFHLARGFGAAMIQRGRGKIIFTASLLSFQGGINVAAYTAAKSGVAGLTRALANEWGGLGVNVNAIVPGYIATDNTEALRADPRRNAAILDRIPAGRWGQAEDVAGAAVFLASAASDYVHGVLLPVDGGWLGR